MSSGRSRDASLFDEWLMLMTVGNGDQLRYDYEERPLMSFTITCRDAASRIALSFHDFPLLLVTICHPSKLIN